MTFHLDLQYIDNGSAGTVLERKVSRCIGVQRLASPDSLDTKGERDKKPKQRADAGFYRLMPLELPCKG